MGGFVCLFVLFCLLVFGFVGFFLVFWFLFVCMCVMAVSESFLLLTISNLNKTHWFTRLDFVVSLL